MTNRECLAFIAAAALEFNCIVDALARASLASPIRDAGADKGLLMPAQVTAAFRAVELDNLFGPAVQSAAAGPMKDLLLPRLERMRELQIELRGEAVRAEDDESTLPGSFIEKYCAAVAELRAYIGAPSPSLGEAKRGDKGNDGQGKADNEPRTRGRKRKYDPEKDQAMAEDWQRAKDYGTSKKDFARGKGLSPRALNRILNRHAKRALN